MSNLSSATLPQSEAEVALELPLRRSPHNVRVWETVVGTGGLSGLASPVGFGSTMPSLRFIHPSRRELPHISPGTIQIRQGAQQVRSDSTSDSTR